MAVFETHLLQVIFFFYKTTFCNFQVLEVDDKDFYVCVNRDVESKFIKADESKGKLSKEDKIDQFVVKHRETITVVQGLANTKLTNPDEWIIKIYRNLSETTFFKGKEIIDKGPFTNYVSTILQFFDQLTKVPIL